MTKEKRSAYGIATDIYLCLLLLFLLWFDSAGLTAIGNAKRNAYYLITALYFLSVFLVLFIQGFRGQRTLRDVFSVLRHTSATQRFVGLYFLFTLISALLSPYRSSVLLGASRYEGLLTLSFYCFSFFLISLLAKPHKFLLWLLSAVLILFCIIGMLQISGKNPFSLYPSDRPAEYYSQSFLGTVGNIDYVAAFLCIVIPFLWVTVLRSTGRKRLFLSIPLLFALILLILIRVAAGFVGILLGGIFSLPVVISGEKKTKLRLAALLFSLLLAFIIVLYLFDFSDTTLHEFHSVLHGTIGENFGTGRIRIWQRVFEKVPKRIWFGYGPGTMSLTGIPNVDVYVNNVLVQTKRIDVAHNEYLNILFHQGIFALLSYLGILFTALYRWLKNADKNALIAAFGAAVLAYAIQAFFSISILITAPYFWCVLALLENSIRHKNRPSG